MEGEQPGQADIYSHDWSPDGTEVVYELRGNPGPIYSLIADLVTGETREFAASGYLAVWSPDGTRIAYTTGDGIYVSKPDGTARLRITKNNANYYDQTAGWSTDSQHVLLNRMTSTKIKGLDYIPFIPDVLRVPATGGTAVNLTKDIDGSARAMYWR